MSKQTSDFESILRSVVSNDDTHARWLNTLSLMENTGARKISASESRYHVTLEILKHAAEESRHAYILKKQIDRVQSSVCPHYTPEFLIAPMVSQRYLDRLDVKISRYLKNELNLEGEKLRFAAYLLVTYAIEVRADSLYPIYQKVLNDLQSRVNVRSIIAEEETHLAEMKAQMTAFFNDWEKHALHASNLESLLFSDWVEAVEKEVVTN